MSPDAFSKKIKKQFSRSPSTLINERVILEAKKLLHLTYRSIKEIALELNFDDEFYFSRYFKKNVGVSPSYYRRNVGISIVAK
jgi:AraC family transcriptional activator of pobA